MNAPLPPPPETWHDAFARLPAEPPPAGGWQALQARLPAPPPTARARWPLWGALAASLLLAVALPMRLPMAPVDDTPAPIATTVPDPALRGLQAESAQLEALLPLLRDDRVASGTAALMAGELELRLAEIDARLPAAGDPAAERALWRSRVETLRALTRLEGERAWLAAQGGRFDAAVVRID
ncbi:hypothetical protein [Luteimonas huabeiensis]|uniref:hypothetical protein n=1 Tax=Luteimonas huabeiensis TaxID=1244513 RepID=UPI0004660E29|nr:hypothetical protein [Luteimonas huabeiensis]